MEKLFEAIGLNANEREVYLAVLSAGKISPQRVARLTGINRTTVYSIAKKLSDSGFITEDVGQKVTYLLAENPENLQKIFEKEEQKLEERKKAAIALSKELATLPRSATYSVPRIHFVEESDLSAYLYAEYARWQESAKSHDDTWWGFQDNTFTETYDAWIDWCWRQTPEVKTRLFLNEVQIEQQMGKKYTERNAKPLPSGVHFDSSFWVVGDYLLMAQTRVRPHYLVVIHDAVLARNQRSLFKGLWDSVA